MRYLITTNLLYRQGPQKKKLQCIEDDDDGLLILYSKMLTAHIISIAI